MRVCRQYQRRKLQTGLAALCFLFFISQTTYAQLDKWGAWENGVSEPWWFASQDFTNEEATTVIARWKSIEAENQPSSINEWRGTYFTGSDTHGSYLRWSPQAGFLIVHVDKCQARVMGFTYGKVKASSTLIQFLPELSKSASRRHGHTQESAPTVMRFVPVKWLGNHHLVAENEMADFGDYVAGLGRYSDSVKNGLFMETVEFFSKRDKREESHTGASASEVKGPAEDLQPIVPPGYERFLKKPVDARIIAVSSGYRKIDRENPWWDNFIIPVTINVGSRHGVKPKTTLRLLGSKGFGGWEEFVELKRVGSRFSTGTIVRTIRKSPCVKIKEDDDCANPVYPPITVGWQLTTSPFK